MEDAPPPPPDGDLPPQLRDSNAALLTATSPPNRHLLNPNPPLPPVAPAGWGQEGSDHSGSDGYNSDGEEQAPSPWHPIKEDTTEPCNDELEFLVSKGEHSALDHEYWEKEAFFDLGDPELIPRESGRIDWLVEGYNGTEDKPNNETLMRSPIVHIGGLDWQIKFYPKGHGSKYLSIYLECVSMLEPDYAEFEEFERPPFPFLEGGNHNRKRRSVAAQLLVVMYNPDEPRVHEHRSEAHQFHKRQADYGWVYFSKYPCSEFHIRQHTQRQAILRNDRLAFKAYIRIIDDPTNSKWEHGSEASPEQIIASTGLRPFKKSLHYIAGGVPLLHFAPFRKLVQRLPNDTQAARWLQPLLLKMYTRQRSPTYKSRGTTNEGDAMEMLWKISTTFHSENADSELEQQWQDLIGAFHSEKGSAFGDNRLNTKDFASIQDAVLNHPKRIACPQLLTLELTRQEHDKKTRKWMKLTNNVRVDDHIQVNGLSYTLFAFITHCGHLMSSKYNSYVRPNGIGNGWYVYQDGLVTRITEKQARKVHSGPDLEENGTQDGYDSPLSEVFEPQSEVSSIVMYVRDDVAAATFETPPEETWELALLQPLLPTQPDNLPHREAPLSNIRDDNTPPAADAINRAEPKAEEMRLETLIQRAADVSTPEPLSMDGEDFIMGDAHEATFPRIESHEMEIHETEINEAKIDEVKIHEAEVPEGTVKGTYSWLGRCHYEGQWKNGKYHGGGYLIETNGDEYIGEFKEGTKHGYGKMIYASTGDEYAGGWANGVHHDRGTLIEASSGNVFDGAWKEGRKHGSFVLTGTVTEEDKSYCTICYDQEITTAFYDCGHVVACRDCAARIEICPVCRRDVHARLQLYGVKVSAS